MSEQRRDLLLILLGAVSLALAFPKPDLHLVVWVAIAPLLYVTARADPWSAIRYGFLFGFVYRAGSMYWVVHAMTEHGGLPLSLATLGAAMLVAYLAVYWSLFALVVSRVGLGSIRAVLLVALCWTGLEAFQGWFLTGFPWTPIGYAAGRSLLLAQLASLVGVAGLTFVAVLVNASIASLAIDRAGGRLPLAVATAAILGAFAYGGWALGSGTDADDGDQLVVGLVQGNVPQDLKWDRDLKRDILDRHVALTVRAAEAGAEIVFWPESSWPDPYGIERDPVAYDLVARVARQHGVHIVVGTVRVDVTDSGRDVANAAVMLGPAGLVNGAYEKTRLVPFGEYLPFQQVLSFLGPLVQAVGTLAPGSADQELLGERAAGLPRFGMSICYEVIFPAIARDQVAEGARFLATITNDAWYGTSSGPYQHFAMARLRAIENRRWLVRAANTGISGAFDPWGRVVASTALETEAVPVVEIGLRRDTTPFQRAGDLLGVLAQVVAAVLVAVALRGRPVSLFDTHTPARDPGTMR